MEDDVVGLNEVVVTALGISREKKSLGYSVQDMKGEELAKAKETNIVNSLSGKISGVQMTNSSGAVGSSSRIVIRGASSLGGNNQPLFIVDGIPISNADFACRRRIRRWWCKNTIKLMVRTGVMEQPISTRMMWKASLY